MAQTHLATLAIQNDVKKFTEIIQECGDKTLRIKKRGKMNKKQKVFGIQTAVAFFKQFTRIAKPVKKKKKKPYITGQC